MIRTYSELLEFDTLEDRYEYLRLGSMVGDETFGFDRWMNQQFYRSREWRHIRDDVIVRDNGFDLGIADVPIRGAPAIHHLKPLTPDDIEEATIYLLDPEYLISTSQRTHNAIHFGDARQLPQPWVERSPGDTRLWGRHR